MSTYPLSLQTYAQDTHHYTENLSMKIPTEHALFYFITKCGSVLSLMSQRCIMVGIHVLRGAWRPYRSPAFTESLATKYYRNRTNTEWRYLPSQAVHVVRPRPNPSYTLIWLTSEWSAYRIE